MALFVPFLIAAGLAGIAFSQTGCSDPEDTPPDQGSSPGRTDGGQSRSDASVQTDRYLPPPDALPDSFVRQDSGLEPDAGLPPPPPRPDVNIAPGSRLAIFSNNWKTFQGFLYSVDLGVSEEAIDRSSGEHPSGPDSALRSFANELYVIERGSGAIQVFDNNFNWLRQIAVQGDEINPRSFSGANAQDIVVLPGAEKAYVSRYDAQDDLTNDDDIWMVDPVSGRFLGSIDLTPLTLEDGLRLARAGQMVYVDEEGLLYVNVPDAGVGDNPFEHNTNGKVAVIDTETDEVVATVRLDGRNPWDITYSEISRKRFVSCTGPYDAEIFGYNTATDFGGIEVIDPETHTTEAGFFIADEDLGGAVTELRLASEDLGFATAGFQHVASFSPATGEVLSTAVYSGLWGFSLGDFSIHTSGALVIADQSINRIVFAGAEIPVEQTPASLAFLETAE